MDKNKITLINKNIKKLQEEKNTLIQQEFEKKNIKYSREDILNYLYNGYQLNHSLQWEKTYIDEETKKVLMFCSDKIKEINKEVK